MKNRLRRFVSSLLGCILLQLADPAIGYPADRYIQVALKEGTEINIKVADAPGSLLVVWFIDHDEVRPQFESMLKAINASGIELWRVDLLADYFLPRSNENIRTLPGEGVAAVIEAAHQHSDKTIVLAAYDRMPLVLLRGVREWSAAFKRHSRLAGSIFYYPNLFGPPPVAGEEPVLDPVVAASNYPAVIVQPETGSQRWRLNEVLQSFWSSGAPVYASLAAEVRDWFFMHPPGIDPRETRATAAVPGEIVKFASLMQAEPKPESIIAIDTSSPSGTGIRGLVPFTNRSPAPPLTLPDLEGRALFSGYQQQLTLINFWATWCPPCVEELPSLNRLKQRFAGRPFNLVSVDFRESRAELRQFTKNIPVDFPILLDMDGQASLAWRVFSFPSSFLVDHNGNIRYSINRAIDWDTQEVYAVIEALLEEVE